MELYFYLLLVICLTFYPVFRSVLGGQKTSLTLMLIALLWKFTSEDNPVAAGICQGFLFYKPQFAVPLFGLYLLSGCFKTVVSGALILGMLIALNFIGYGTHWLTSWINFTMWFSPADAITNKNNAISWTGLLSAVSAPKT
jgi:hypothetical protein